jgi:arsenite-transporting ATPase
VLVVSTDPAHSLGDALGRRLGPEPAGVPLAAGSRGALWAAEIAAERALERWLAPRRAGLAAAIERGTYLDGADAARLLSLTPPGVDELAAILELPRLAAATGCDELVVDTAPTAHTLRLVAAPETLERLAAFLDALQERHRELAVHFGGARPAAGPADSAIADLATAAGEVAALLRDRERSAFVWVLLPETLAVAETADGVAALEAQGVPVREIVVNRVTQPENRQPRARARVGTGGRGASRGCPLCRARRAAELAAIAELRRVLPGRPLRFLPALPTEPRGRAALRRIGRALTAPDGGAGLAREEAPPTALARREPRPKPASARPLVWPNLLAPPGVRLLFFGGKGGVGKTTCAAAAALVLAETARAGARRPVLALSTDPAHSLGDALDTSLDDSPRPVPGGPANLRARELDAGHAFAAWREKLGEAADELVGTLAGTAGGSSDLADLAPAGMDELVALATLIDALDEAGDELVVVDTAPTGHTLRLLALPELALAWDHALLALLLKYRAAARPGPLAAELVELAGSLRRFAALLADPARVRFVAVARAAALPRRETARLVAALARLRIAPAALLANALPPPAAGRCPRCAPESLAAGRELAALARAAAGRCPLLSAPLAIPPPRGAGALREWAQSWRVESRRGRARRSAAL